MRRVWSREAPILVGCVVVGLGLSWLLFDVLLHPPASHVIAAMEYFVISGVISLLAGVAGLALAARYVPSLGAKIGIVSLFGSAAALINVIVTPWLMFSQRSDFYILVITLLYFLAISLAFAVIVGTWVTRQIRALHEGATLVAAGDFDARVDVSGTDEVADLGRAFNQMAAQLGDGFARQRQLEEARTDLIAAVSHDLRTPLAAIRAMVEAINDGVVTDPDEVRRYLRLIHAESEHLGSLIDDLFELSRLETGNLDLRLASVPLSELVSETVDGLRIRAADKGVALTAACDGDVPELALDGPRIQRALVNLVDNAIRHTPSGGEVDVAVAQRDGYVEVAVADTGEGIPPEDRPHIFEQFYRGEKSRSRGEGGAGLGLAIARGIVEAHRGTIRVESNRPRGSRFIITLFNNGQVSASEPVRLNV